jgi:hypothetical protein
MDRLRAPDVDGVILWWMGFRCCWRDECFSGLAEQLFGGKLSSYVSNLSFTRFGGLLLVRECPRVIGIGVVEGLGETFGLWIS